MSSKDADTLVELNKQLASALHSSIVVEQHQLKKTLENVKRIVSGYGISAESSSLQLLLRMANREINSTATPAMEKAYNSLADLYALNSDSTIAERRRVISVLVRDLEHFIQDEQSVSSLTIEDQRQIRSMPGVLKVACLPEDADLSNLTYIQDLVREVQKIIYSAFSRQQGLVQRTSKNFSNHLDALTQQLIYSATTQVGRLAQDFIGQFTSSTTGGDNTTVNSIVEQGQKILSSIASQVETAASRHIASCLAMLINMVYQTLQTHLTTTTPHNRILIRKINDCITQMNEAEQRGNWQEIVNSLTKCFSALHDQEVYFQGIRVPLKVSPYYSAVPSLLEQVKSHENALSRQKPQASLTTADLDEMITQTTQRATAFCSIRLVNQLCALSLEESTYPTFLKTDSNIPAHERRSVFRQRFFAYIDHAKISSFKKYCAKACYKFIHVCTGFVIDIVVEKIKREFLRFQQKDPSLRAKEAIRWLRKWLSELSGIYSQVANTPKEKITDIFVLLNQTVKSPERNAGLQSGALYKAVFKTFMKFVSINWMQAVNDHFDNSRIPTQLKTSWAAPLLSAMNVFCKKTLQFLLFLPQLVVNFLLQKTISVFVLRSVQLDKLLDAHLEQFQDPLTPISFKIHQVIYEKMFKIASAVHEHLNEASQASTIGLTQDILTEVGSCVHVLLEVIHKSRYPSVDRLKAFVQLRLTTNESIEKEIEEFFLPQAMPAIAMTFWTAITSIMHDNELLELCYTGFSVANACFDPQISVTPAQIQALDKGTGDQIDRILEAMLLYLLSNKLDISNSKQQEEVNKFIATLRSQTQTLAANLNENCKKIHSRPEGGAQDLIEELINLSRTFLNARILDLGQADGNRFFHSETKNRLNLLIEKLGEVHQPISHTINGMIQLQKEINKQREIQKIIIKSREKLSALENLLCAETAPLNPMSSSMVDPQKNLTQLAKLIENPDNTLEKLSGQLSNTRAQIEKNQTLYSLMKTIFSQFNTFIQCKRTHINRRNQQVTTLYKNLNTLLEQAPQMHQNRLLPHLQAAMTASSVGALMVVNAEFTREYSTLFNQVVTQLQKAQTEFRKIHENIGFHLTKEEQAAEKEVNNTNASLKKLNEEELPHCIENLSQWGKNVQDITIYNIVLFNHMQWIQEMIRGLAMWRARIFVAEIRAIFVQRHMYESLIHQALLLFLHAHGPEFLQTQLTQKG